MKTKVFNWQEKIDENELQEVINTIKNDGLIIFPTDTVYGLACNCLSETAIEKIFDIKKRERGKPINVLTNSVEKIKLVVEKMSDKEKELVEKYMPGSLTIIFDKNDKTPNNLTAGLKTIGARIPNNKIALSILERLDFPLATTSANLAGDDAGIKVEDFIKTFDNQVDIIIDGGESDLKIASTIIRVENDKIITLREGTTKISD